MKLLVPASYAQFGVGAERRRAGRACGERANPNGMGISTLSLWRPVVVQKRTPAWSKRLLYEAGCEPARRYKPSFEGACCVQSSLPCVSSAGQRCHAYRPTAMGEVRYCLSKDCLQKRIRVGTTLQWKSPRLSFMEQARD